jgi:hypothetical protein
MKPTPSRTVLLLAVAVALPAAVRAETPLFGRQVAPLLYKLGCSAGPCHGAFGGKGNFRLSLFAADPAADYRNIRGGGFGRRLNFQQPGESLLLLKPTGAVIHGGGVPLRRGGPDYALLRAWIEAGAPYDPEAEGQVLSLRVEPAAFALDDQTPAQPLRVLARLSGGTEEDVTRWARFESLDDQVADVSRDGLVRRVHPGDTPVLAHYAGQIAFTTALVPAALPAGVAFPEESLPDKVDQLLAAKWRRLHLVPAPRCDDSTFLRRAYLDVTGSLPLPEQTRKFLADPDPNKRARLIDELLDHPLHSAVWALKLLDLVGADDRFGAPVYAWYDQLRGKLQKNEPWDRIASPEYIAGLKFNQGNDGMQTLDARKVALQVAYAYLGLHLECAQCHKHPHDRWSQNDFFSFAAAFAYTDAKASPGKPVELFHDAATGQPLAPRVLGGPAIELKPGVNPRQEVFRWIVAPDNPYFARAMVNRVWAHYFGRGLFDPVDAQAAARPPAHPEVLDELARDFVEHHYDLRHLHRRVLNTAAYQRGWQTNAGNARDERNFSHHALRLLQAEQVVDAINQVTGAPLKVTPPYAKLPAGRVMARAVELPPSRLSPTDDGYVLQIFGRPLRTQASDYERGNAPSQSQVLYLYNSKQLHDKIADDKGRLRKLVDEVKDDRQLVEELYLLTLTRPPAPAEVERALANLRAAPSRREGYQEILWSLLNHKEFLVNR